MELAALDTLFSPDLRHKLPKETAGEVLASLGGVMRASYARLSFARP